MNGHIALFCASLHGGGAERVMLNLARGFLERGFKVDLVLAKTEGPLLEQVPVGVAVVDLGARRVLSSIPGLIRYLRRERPVAMLSAMDHVNVAALLAVRLAGVETRLVASVHTVSLRKNITKFGDRIIHHVLLRRLYPWADAVVAVSEGVKRTVLSRTGLSDDQVRVIHNPVVTPELFENAKEDVEHPWFAPTQPPVILGAGRLTKAKDFASLIRAVALVRNERKARLIILGEGPDRSELEALVRTLELEDDVDLPGFVGNPYACMAQASVFVMSSNWEGLPTVLIESMAVGCPVVSTDCPAGPSEILDNGQYGSLVPVGDVQELANAILSNLQEPVDSKPLRERANLFSLKSITEQYVKVLLDSPTHVGEASVEAAASIQ